jgi:hypothetical protein
MIFPAVEYDAGASLHLSNAPSFQLINAHSRRGEAPTLSFFPSILNFKCEVNTIECCQAGRVELLPLYRLEIRLPLIGLSCTDLEPGLVSEILMFIQCN